jgi:predicted dehydrogenase
MKIINTALCSFGMSGLIFHASFIDAHPGFNLYAVWERSTKSAKEKYPTIKSFDTLDEMLADDTIDLVIVNTPNYTHFEFTKLALLAGKHVLVEKAFTDTYVQAEELVTLAKKLNRKLAVYQNRRYDSDFKTVKKVVDTGLLGDIVDAEIHFDRFKIELSPKLHKETALPAAGLLHDLGPHIIDQALYLFGMPEAVFGFLRYTRPSTLVNDYFDIQLFYPSLTVRLKSSLLVKELLPGYIINGSNGSFVKLRSDIQEDSLKAGMELNDSKWGLEPENEQGILNYISDGNTIREHIISEKGNYMELFNGLYLGIANDTNPPITGKDGANVMQIIDAVQLSNSSKAIVNLSL